MVLITATRALLGSIEVPMTRTAYDIGKRSFRTTVSKVSRAAYSCTAVPYAGIAYAGIVHRATSTWR